MAAWCLLTALCMLGSIPLLTQNAHSRHNPSREEKSQLLRAKGCQAPSQGESRPEAVCPGSSAAPCQVGAETFCADLAISKQFQMWAGDGKGVMGGLA